MGMVDGKVAILIGSGCGIGAATAKMFGAEGASLVGSDLDPAQLIRATLDLGDGG